MFQFEGTEGEWFQKLTARFCSHQTWALDQIKNRQKKEPRFNSFILVAQRPGDWSGTGAGGTVTALQLLLWCCRRRRASRSAAGCS